MNKVDQQFDVVIVGGGMIGLSLAVALGDESLSILLLEQNTTAPVHANALDLRTTGLTRSSIQFFSEIGMAAALDEIATPITRLDISEQGGFACARIDGEENSISPIGHMVPNHELISMLSREVQAKKNITVMSPAKLLSMQETAVGHQLQIEIKNKIISCETALLIGADGVKSKVRELLGIDASYKDYKQTAIISNIKTELLHQNVAFERLTKNGPLAVLPVQDDMCALIWTHNTEEAAQLLELSDADFIASLQQAFGYRLGRILSVGKRVSYPLSLTMSETLAQMHAVLIGNAAQSIHPVAAQGFNLGLRDVHTLVHMLREINFDSHLYQQILQEFQKHRQQDRNYIVRLTDGLTTLFGVRIWPLQMLRGCGIRALATSRVLQRGFLRRNLGVHHLFAKGS